MEKLFTIYFDTVPKFNIPLCGNTKVKNLKRYFEENFSNYAIRLFINSKQEIEVFDTDKYDDMRFESVWDKVTNGKIYLNRKFTLSVASTSRQVCSFDLFDYKNPEIWENAYKQTIDKKYQKLTRNFSKEIKGTPCENPKIYLIPRERGGPSYKSIDLIGARSEDVFFAPVSKGYSMQDVSSFTLGPVVGEGLNIVNAAFSKSICIFHIEGGNLDLKRKNFWNRKKKIRDIVVIDENNISVDGKDYRTFDWLQNNKKLWFDEFEKWRKSVALCSNGDFHWCDCEEDPLAYYLDEKFVGFVEWKKKAYIEPAYKLIPQTPVYNFLEDIFKNQKISLGLVHPKARKNFPEEPITAKQISDLYNSPTVMACMPYVLAGILLGVNI